VPKRGPYQQQQREGESDQDDAQRLRGPQIGFECRVDRERQGLRTAREVAREHERGSELAQRARPAHGGAGYQARQRQRQCDPKEDPQGRGPERTRHQQQIRIDALECAAGRLHEEWRRNEDFSHDDGRRAERHRPAVRIEQPCEQPASAERQQQRNARYGRRDDDWQLHCRLDDARKAARRTRERPGERGSECEHDQHADRGGDQTQLERRPHQRMGKTAREFGRAGAEDQPHERRCQKQHQHAAEPGKQQSFEGRAASVHGVETGSVSA
jgi:hypothetical protein